MIPMDHVPQGSSALLTDLHRLAMPRACLHCQTPVAGKAARRVPAAGGCQLAGFGLRRPHGAEAGPLPVRAVLDEGGPPDAPVSGSGNLDEHRFAAH